jgi:hypothetical protein
MARILIVDDSPTQTLSLSQILKKHGHEIITAKDGSKALKSPRRNCPTGPDGCGDAQNQWFSGDPADHQKSRHQPYSGDYRHHQGSGN